MENPSVVTCSVRALGLVSLYVLYLFIFLFNRDDEEFCYSSLLENQKFIDFVHNPLCECGATWECTQAKSKLKQVKTTEESFMLRCKCGNKKH